MAGSDFSQQFPLQYLSEDFQNELLKEISPLLSKGGTLEELETQINSFIDQSTWKDQLSNLSEDEFNFSPTILEKITGDQQLITALSTGCWCTGAWSKSCPCPSR